ncbi:hypothetical protein O5559_28465, partial [Escherichia coli]|nr:hypothetical protein [Escherichia coli]
VNFRIQHLGYSWLYGTFKDFDGTILIKVGDFTYPIWVTQHLGKRLSPFMVGLWVYASGLKTSVSPVTGVWCFMITMKFAT